MITPSTTMKTLLQINLQSQLDRNCYRTRRDSLQVLGQQHHFDSILFSAEDINSTICHDIVMDCSMQALEADTRGEVSVVPMGTSGSSNQARTQQQQQQGQCAVSYSVLLDQCSDGKPVQNLISQLASCEMFRRQPITVAHFLIHDNSLYDFHRPHSASGDGNDSEQQWEGTGRGKNQVQMEDNYTWRCSTSGGNKQLSVCQQLRPDAVSELTKLVQQLPVQSYLRLAHPDLGTLHHQSITKAEEIRLKQLQAKKVVQFYRIRVGYARVVNVVMLHHNRNYGLTGEEVNEMKQLLMMHGSRSGEIRFKSTRVEMVNWLMRGTCRLFYALRFPGPALEHGHEPKDARDGRKNQRKAIRCRNVDKSRETGAEIGDTLRSMFQFHHALVNQDKQCTQRIIKEYLIRKEESLKLQLQNMREKVKELRLSHRIQESEVNELRIKCTRALEKMSQSIFQLQKMNIKNVQKHIDWLKTVAEEKKQSIREYEEQIEEVNQRIVESRQSHKYFLAKMIQFRDKLKQKQLQTLKKDIRYPQKLIEIENVLSNKENSAMEKQQLTELSREQLQLLEEHKEKLNKKLHDKLRNSYERKSFMDTFAEIKTKTSKIETSRLEQKYFDLLHE